MSMRLRKIAKLIAFVAIFSAVLIGSYFAFTLKNMQFEPTGSNSVSDIAYELVERQLLPSISYAVIENGEIDDVRTFGTADFESGAKVDDQTLYEAASLTKPVVAEIARRLYQQGVLSLDERVADTLDIDRISDKKALAKLTPRHLLSHMSGLPNWSGDSRDLSRTNPLKFEFDPGLDFQYSGEGYGILLAFLEAKSGKGAEQLVSDMFSELGMKNSTLVGKGFPGEYARGHWANSPSRPAWRSNEPIAAYSLFTNAHDYALFLQYVIKSHASGLSSDEPFIAATAKVKSVEANDWNEQIGWALGWGTLERKTDTIYFQWGDNGVFRSFAAFDPIKQNGVVYFTNGSFGTIYADELAEPILGDVSSASSWFATPWKEIARTWLGF